jgi:hypothetical protein
MAYFYKTQIFVLLAASFGAAYSQSVVIDGGNIRVDAPPGQKATVTTKGDKATASKMSKTEGGVASVGKGGKVFVNTDFSGQVHLLQTWRR